MKNILTPAFDPAEELISMEGDHNKNLVAFIDYTCPHTRRLRGVLRRSLEKFKSLNITVAFRFAPTEQQQTESAELASRAAIAANQQGCFAIMHRALFEEEPYYTRDNLAELANRLGYRASTETREEGEI